MRRNATLVAIGAVMIVGIVIATTADAQTGPVVSTGFNVEVFASVTDPASLSFDSSGNLFVGSGSNRAPVPIHRVSADGSTVVEFGPAILDPVGVIVDISGAVATLGPGSVLVAAGVGSRLSRITQISPSGSANSQLFMSTGTELADPQQLAFDSDGKLLFANCRSGTVGIIDASVLTLFATVADGNCLAGIAISSDGRVFVSDRDDGTVAVLDADGALLDPAFVSGLSNPDDMAFDTLGQFGGRLFVAEGGGGRVLSVDPDTGVTDVIAKGFDIPSGLAFGPDGCLFVSESGGDTIWRICKRQITLVGPVAPPTVLSGAELDVVIRADDVQDLAGAQFTLTYDPPVLVFVSAQPGDDFAGCFAASNDVGGAVNLVLTCVAGRTGVPLDLWTVRFVASEVSAPTEIDLGIANLLLSDSQAEAILGEGGTAVLEVLGVCGDLNGDGHVNVFDAIIGLQIIVGLITPTELQLILSDVVRDGAINVFDVILTLQHIVGSTQITGCGPPAP